MDYPTLFATSFIIALSGAMAPGPVLAGVLGQSLASGARTGVLMATGHALLETLLVAVLMFGAARWLNSPTLLRAIFGLGAGVLLFMGAGLLIAPPGPAAAQGRSRSGRLIRDGLVLSLASPYWLVWWMTVGLGLMLGASRGGWGAVGVFLAGHLAADYLWYGAVSLAVARGGRWMGPAVHRGLMAVCGLTMMAFALLFVRRALLP